MVAPEARSIRTDDDRGSASSSPTPRAGDCRLSVAVAFCDTRSAFSSDDRRWMSQGARPPSISRFSHADLAAGLDAARALPHQDRGCPRFFVLHLLGCGRILITTCASAFRGAQGMANVAHVEVGVFRRAFNHHPAARRDHPPHAHLPLGIDLAGDRGAEMPGRRDRNRLLSSDEWNTSSSQT